MIKVTEFAEIEAEFRERAQTMVWCSFTTVDTLSRPRARVMHPIWENSTGWIATNRSSLKGRHLAHNPFVSLAYIAHPLKPAYAECTASWEDDLEPKRHIWELFRSTPPPLGYDPAIIWHTAENPEFGLIKLLPYRITLGNLAAPGELKVWRGSPEMPLVAVQPPKL